MAPSVDRIQVLFDAEDPEECVVLEIDQSSTAPLARFVWMTEGQAHDLLGRLAEVLALIQARRVAGVLSTRPGRPAN